MGSVHVVSGTHKIHGRAFLVPTPFLSQSAIISDYNPAQNNISK